MSDREKELREAAERQPADASARSELAAHYFSAGQLDEAIREYTVAVELAPDVAEGHYNLAAALNASGDSAAALDIIENAALSFPASAPIHYGRACVLQNLGRLDDALAAFTVALELEPDRADTWYGVGVLLLRLGDPRRASCFFERALDVAPEHAAALYMRQALSGEARTRPNEVFVRELFDSYAAYYDAHMLETLGYRAPEMLCRLLEPLLGDTPANVLDLGCGTGLLGRHLRARAERLVGVDLAQGMLDKAQALECYDRLVCADVVEYLQQQEPATHDVVVSADLFIYFADLAEVFAAIAKVLTPDGLFAFTVEEDESEDWSVGPSGRFQHSRPYLDALRDEMGFATRSFERAVLRHDGGDPCHGFIVVWSRRDTPQANHL